MYKHPGVYIEHVPSGVLAIEAASTSIAAFIGPVKRGPVGEPVLITNRDQFAKLFGELDDDAGGIRNYGDTPDYFGHAVNAFYDNGGRQAYIVRVANGETKAKGALTDRTDPAKALYLTAKNGGKWGEKIVATVEPVDETGVDLTLGFDLEIGFETLQDDGSLEFTALESFTGVSMNPNSGQYVEKILNAQSELVDCAHTAISGPDGLNLSARKGGSLRDLADLNTLKNKVLNIQITGVKVKIKFLSDLKSIEVTRDAGGADDLETLNAAAAMASLPDLATNLTSAIAQHPELDGFVAALTSDEELVLIPGPLPASASATMTATVSLDTPAGAAGDTLKLTDAEGGTTVSLPATGRALFLPASDGGAVGKSDYTSVFTTLRDYRDISILLLPGLTWSNTDSGKEIIGAAITHAEFMKNRVVIVDPIDPIGSGSKLENAKQVKDQGFPTSTFSALYYPWMEVTNPHYDPDTAANLPVTHAVPPSGFAAGLWARIDGSRGVWKAPAGLEATVRGIRGPNVLVGNDIQAQLNDWGVNCVRSIIGPSVIWGARTLATKVKPDQRYVPVRRTSAMIGESLYNALQAVVFEPNKHTLWASLRASASDFMDTLFRAGAFQGEKASEAYYVQCGLGQTMTQADIDAGIVRLVVGYAPLKPAEFVVVQIKQIVGQRG